MAISHQCQITVLFEFTTNQILITGLLFIWAGFVRSGLGFGGAALGLPLLLFVYDQPIYWLPVIGWHLLFFSSLTLTTRLNNVDWKYLGKACVFIIPAALVGVFGLLNLPNNWLLLFIYSISLAYGTMWAMGWHVRSDSPWLDRLWLTLGGYIAGTSLTGAPLMVAVFMQNVTSAQLRNTLFVLWFALVSIKMSAFAALDVPMHITSALVLLPVAAIGHVIGLKTHDLILRNDHFFKRVIGSILVLISFLGLLKLLSNMS